MPEENSHNLKGLKICITGFLDCMSRREAEKRITERGGIFKNSVTRDLSFLVAEEGWESEKTDRAKDLGIPIINRSRFFEFLAGAEVTPEEVPDRAIEAWSFEDLKNYWKADVTPLNKIPADITYVDKSGNEKEKSIIINSLKTKDNGEMMIAAYSNTDKGPRAFLITSIKKLLVKGIEYEPSAYFKKQAANHIMASKTPDDLAREALTP
jgi:hypothetical protein